MKRKGTDLVALFRRYGPQALKVEAYIRVLREASRDELTRIDHKSADWAQLESLVETVIVERVCTLRQTELASAQRAAEEVLKRNGPESEVPESQIDVTVLIAKALVIEDFLNREERGFLFRLVSRIALPGALYVDHDPEDLAIEAFCEQLSIVDEQVVWAEPLDIKGQQGEGLPDFVLHRDGSDHTVEHTSLTSYQRKRQVYYEKVWEKYLEPTIYHTRKRMVEAFPRRLVRVDIPIDAFQKESEARHFDFHGFIENVVEAVGKTPESDNAAYMEEYQFLDTPFPVFVSKCRYRRATCLVTRILPTNNSAIRKHLEAEINGAIRNKGAKLCKYKAKKGTRTMLLLHSDDEFVNEEILAEAFASAASQNKRSLNGIDSVYMLWHHLAVPVKIEDRLYPDLPEFEEYFRKQTL